MKNADEDSLYLCGQSLGLKPKCLDENVQKVLDSWSQRGVHSHFHGYMPAALSDLPAKKPMAQIVGAKEHEIAILNGLTVNLHLLLATFYRPNQKRFKLIIEEHAFPSDTVSATAQCATILLWCPVSQCHICPDTLALGQSRMVDRMVN